MATPDTPVCLNLTAHVDPRFGGLTTSIPPFCDALSDTGRYRAEVLAFCSSGEVPAPDIARTQPVMIPAGRLPHTRRSSEFERRFESAAVIHAHGLWQEQSHIAARFARKLHKPLIVSAHGMLDDWALQQGALKKKIYWKLIEGPNLSRAACLRALTRMEAEQYRRMGLECPVAVVPNGVSVPEAISPEPFYRAFPALRDRKLVLFLGRLHKKKGIHLLLEAWGTLSNDFPQAQLVIAGPESDETRESIREIVNRRDIQSRVTFTGMLNGDRKWGALAAASGFILPSYSEGFSVAVLEALATGTPVIISDRCYFPEIAESCCGWVIKPVLEEVTSSIAQLLQQDSSERLKMGSRGKRLAGTSFSWPSVGQRMADLLDWVTNGGAPPPSVSIL